MVDSRKNYLKTAFKVFTRMIRLGPCKIKKNINQLVNKKCLKRNTPLTMKA